MRYVYCPQCGSKLGERLAGDEGMVPYCEQCGKYRFDTFACASIIMVVNEQHEIALLKQLYQSDTYWTYVAGFIKPGETAEETAVREVKEELGLVVEQLDYAGTYWFAQREQLMHGFIGHVRKAPFALSVEVDEAEWVSIEEAPSRMFPDRPGNCQHPIYRLYLESL